MHPAKPTSTHTDCFFPISVSKCRFGGKIMFAPNLHLLTTASCQTYIYSHVSKCRFGGKIISLPNLHLLTMAMVFFREHSYLRRCTILFSHTVSLLPLHTQLRCDDLCTLKNNTRNYNHNEPWPVPNKQPVNLLEEKPHSCI